MLPGLHPGLGMRGMHSGISASQMPPWGRASRPGTLATAHNLWLQHSKFLSVQGMQDKGGRRKSVNRPLLLKTKAEPCRNCQVYPAEPQNGLSGGSHTCTQASSAPTHAHLPHTHTGMHTHKGGTVDTRAHSCSQGLSRLHRDAIVTFGP